jgi:lipoprotein-anchoring transpeptidase ErfK/SrfK
MILRGKPMLRASILLLTLTAAGALAGAAEAQSWGGRNGLSPDVIAQPLPPPSGRVREGRVLPDSGELDAEQSLPPLDAPDDLPDIDPQYDPGPSRADDLLGDDADTPVRPPRSIGAAPASPVVGGPPPAAAPLGSSPRTAALPPEDLPEEGQPKALPQNLRRQLVDYPTKEPAGTILIDTAHTYLYLVLGQGKAVRYGIGVGREGFTWAGTERVSRMKEWPDWFPPPEMIERQPYLPRMMAGGRGNPLGARALYLGRTLYRIHGTNQPSTIGSFVSSGCIRLLNEDIEDLYSRVQVGTRVVVLPGKAPSTAAQADTMPGASATRASVMVEPAVDRAPVPPLSLSPAR